MPSKGSDGGEGLPRKGNSISYYGEKKGKTENRSPEQGGAAEQRKGGNVGRDKTLSLLRNHAAEAP